MLEVYYEGCDCRINPILLTRQQAEQAVEQWGKPGRYHLWDSNLCEWVDWIDFR